MNELERARGHHMIDEYGMPQKQEEDLGDYSVGDGDVEQADVWTKIVAVQGIYSKDQYMAALLAQWQFVYRKAKGAAIVMDKYIAQKAKLKTMGFKDKNQTLDIQRKKSIQVIT